MSRIEAAIAAAQQALAGGDAQGARAQLQRALRRDPADPDLNLTMARVLFDLKERDQAVYHAERACRARPGDSAAMTMYSWAVSIGRAPAEVAEHLERAIAADPANPALRYAITDAYFALSRPAAAARHGVEGVRRWPDHLPLVVKALAALHQSAQVPEFIGLARGFLARHPGEQNVAFGLTLELMYAESPDPAEVLAAHVRAASLLERGIDRTPVRFSNTPDPDRTLRVGLLSPDLRRHSVAYFVEPLLRHRDPGAVEVVCYSTVNRRDEVSHRLASLATAWRDAEELDDAALAAAVREDRIDILIDLSGHTRGHRLAVFLHGPAPVTATYIGYPATTGMRAIGARLVDSLTDPPGAERWCVERLVRLDPCFLCYQPPEHAPAPAPPPCGRAGAGVTFGSFNALNKVNDGVVRAWAAVLARVPGSRLVLKAPQFSDPDVRAMTLERFGAAGADAARITILERVAGPADHLAQYAMIDVGLDPFPYCGTTTTCEALWMGVPVVTLAGDSHGSRVGLSLLSAAGLGECVASSVTSYVDLAAGLGSDTARLAALRAGLRERVASSVLCDGPSFARRFERVVRGLWRDYCESERARQA